MTLILSFLMANVNAQLKIDAELRPRFEYRHGYKTLFPDNEDPASFVGQRTRLKVSYNVEKLDFFLSVQDVRVWGDVPQLNSTDNNGISVHEAWANIGLGSNWFLKFGRQEIIYDDSRMFGNVNWANQGRSHDLAMLKHKKNSFKFDLGLAFNQSSEALTGTVLNTPNTYKSFQYIWFQNTWGNVSGSFLFLNNGLQYIDELNSDNNETRYSQTLGTHFKFGKGKFGLQTNLFYQFGKDKSDNDLNAYLIGLETSYKISQKTKIGLGAELLSGNDNGAPSNGDNKAFTPFYGTNHKFNGLMDYFYVGNHSNNVGLADIYLSSNFILNAKSNLNIAFHNFSAAGNLTGSDDKQLGNELDLVYTYKMQKNVTLKAGYSQMFASDGMEILKGNTDGNTNNWGWVMIVVNPTLFKNNN